MQKTWFFPISLYDFWPVEPPSWIFKFGAPLQPSQQSRSPISMGETDLDTLQARQILPSDFSYGGVACQLRTTTNFCANFCSNIRNAANVPSPSLPTFLQAISMVNVDINYRLARSYGLHSCSYMIYIYIDALYAYVTNVITEVTALKPCVMES
jgi:hypothetical protein